MATSLTNNTLTLGNRVISETINYSQGSVTSNTTVEKTGPSSSQVGDIYGLVPYKVKDSASRLITVNLRFPSGMWAGFYCWFTNDSNDYPRASYTPGSGSSFTIEERDCNNSLDGGGESSSECLESRTREGSIDVLFFTLKLSNFGRCNPLFRKFGNYSNNWRCTLNWWNSNFKCSEKVKGIQRYWSNILNLFNRRYDVVHVQVHKVIEGIQCLRNLGRLLCLRLQWRKIPRRILQWKYHDLLGYYSICSRSLLCSGNPSELMTKEVA